MKILKCPSCKTYTLKEACPKCGAKTATAHPPRFSIEREKKWGKYRRMGKNSVNSKTH